MKSFVGNLVRLMLGRKLLVRISRFFLNEARLDHNNSMYQNGELLIQREVLKQPNKYGLMIFDVGANVGEWSLNLLKQADTGKVDIKIYCFEPSGFTCKLLRKSLSEYEKSVVIENAGLSDVIGTGMLLIVGEGLGVNSLYEHEVSQEYLREELIQKTTIDQYCKERNINQIHFLKIDAEGHDCKVILGAGRMLSEERINVIQFEYSWRWLASRQYLKDIFDLIKGTTYKIGKLTKYGIEIYSKWDLDLETFTEGNYVLLKANELSDFPRVKWWKN